MNRPRWRWWLFCVVLEAHRVLGWGWLSDLWCWCILPEWLGWDGDHDTASAGESGEAPW